MKTPLKFTPKKVLSSLGCLTILMFLSMAFNPIYGQNTKTASTQVSQKERTIKGVVKDEQGPLESASITLKGSNVGTTTNSKGEFTFPKALKTGDVLLITYLGYDTVEVEIKDNTTFINQIMSEDLIEFVGALNTNKPYKSKRNN